MSEQDYTEYPKIYLIFSERYKKFLLKNKSFNSSRSYFIYGDLTSAKRKLNQLKRDKKYEDDKLRVIETNELYISLKNEIQYLRKQLGLEE